EPQVNGSDNRQQNHCYRFGNGIEVRKINGAAQLLRKVTPRRATVATGFHSALLLRALLIADSPVRIGLKLLNATILSNDESACEKPGRTLGVAHRHDDCVRAFFDPVADVIRVKSRLLR